MAKYELESPAFDLVRPDSKSEGSDYISVCGHYKLECRGSKSVAEGSEPVSGHTWINIARTWSEDGDY